jgi:hypothetical protein
MGGYQITSDWFQEYLPALTCLSRRQICRTIPRKCSQITQRNSTLLVHRDCEECHTKFGAKFEGSFAGLTFHIGGSFADGYVCGISYARDKGTVLLSRFLIGTIKANSYGNGSLA